MELVEDDEDDVAVGTPPHHGAGAAPRDDVPHDDVPHDDDPHAHDPQRDTGRRRRVVVLVALVAVLAVVAVVGQAVVSSRERERVAALAGLPGILEAIDGPVEVVRSGSDDVLLASTARTPDGWSVVQHEDEAGRTTARAVDPLDGTVRWETELVAAGTALAVLPGGEAVRSRGACLPADGDLLVCQADNATALVGRGTVTQLRPTVTRLVVLDARDGTQVADLSGIASDAWLSTSAGVVDDLVVVAGTDGATTVVRATTVAGDVVWEEAFPATTTTSYGAQVTVMPTTDGVAVASPTALRLLDTSGRTVGDVALTADRYVRTTAGDAVVVGSTGPDGTLVVDPHGSRVLRGSWVASVADDGSAPGLVLTSDGDGVHAWSTDGTERWTADLHDGGSGAIVLAGRVVLGHGTAVVALDATTGAEVWRTPDLLPDSGIATDGRYVLTLDATPGGSARQDLVALDARDGGPSWRVTLPHAVEALLVRAGTLLTVARDDEGAGLAVTVLR